MVPITVGNPLLLTNHGLGQPETYTEEDKDCPLPSEWVEGNAKQKPPEQLKICEKVKSTRGAAQLQHLCHVDPTLHPPRARAGKGVHEKHEEYPRVDTNMPVAD